MNLVIVESPSKINIIQKILGDKYKVIASGGHIRELEPKNGSIDTDNDFAPKWQENAKVASFLKKIPKSTTEIYLATDPDREGEAISWHIIEVTKQKFSNIKFKRVTFNAITKKDILDAFKKAHELNQDLVNAYLARLSIDYLVGFNLSPVLWKKLPGSKSAGRVQSVALRLVVERESEIFLFNKEEYWNIFADFFNDNCKIECNLTAIESVKLSKMDIKNEAQCLQIVKRLEKEEYTVTDIETKQQKTSPNPAFHTVSIQQYAFNNLSMNAVTTMKIAQELYEGIELNNSERIGLITYMRTDSTVMSNEAVSLCRDYVLDSYGEKYLHSNVRIYKSKAKNSQEAHEAIRPTDFTKTPAELKSTLNDRQYALYNAIWKRAIASQMSDAIYEARNIQISSKRNDVFKGREKKLIFDGHLFLFKKENSINFIDIKENIDMNFNKIDYKQNFTAPPARYNEGSLIKQLEELGIGRPSTYARIIQVIKDRKYIVINKKKMYPESRGIAVISFLKKHFTKYVSYDFTAFIEEELDKVSSASANFLDVLKDFWKDFDLSVKNGNENENQTIIEEITDDLYYFFSKEKNLACPKCAEGKILLKVGKFGLFWGCSTYFTTNCNYILKFSILENNDEVLYSKDNVKVEVKNGQYGDYIKITKENEHKNISFKSLGIKDKEAFEDLSDTDIEKIINLPFKLTTIKGEDVMINTGKYNPCAIYKGKEYKLSKNIFSVNIDDVKKIIKFD